MNEFDVRFFHWLNGVVIHPWLDWAMPIVTSWKSWGMALGGGALYLVLARGARGRQAVLSIILAVALGDLVAAQVMKPGFHRLRPCQAAIGARVLDSCRGRYGFPSNHATNVAAAGGALGMFYPATLVVTVPCALLVGWSRVYLGVHYPGDVAGGFLFGGVLGVLIALLVQRGSVRRLPEN